MRRSQVDRRGFFLGKLRPCWLGSHVVRAANAATTIDHCFHLFGYNQ